MSVELVLGSSSPYRRAILDKLHLPYQVCKPEIDETARADESAEQLVLRLAQQKALAVAERLNKAALIIGSDQVAVCDGMILGKPGSEANARQQLQRCSGKRVTFLTGLALYHSGIQQMDSVVEPFSVEFRSLTDEEIAGYVRLEQPLNCAGSFKSEGLGISLFTRMVGDDPNALIGLPTIRLLEMLRKHQINPLTLAG
ncbi:septum formation inhibitor Maf [Idiomarina tyrosinivorans]|uniref:7-methyl-GTP pyrophosphatase n=1 Tax=Idiomarina tyrosinivorans TaxID=1445662 RepID=A0A432ZU38_9GAMM|nr:Maf family protein [Idiomarina tyrosinivorans]RUO81361.1 septum formation inhibitor Maf [Idiomarina tyrosinivorans]